MLKPIKSQPEDSSLNKSTEVIVLDDENDCASVTDTSVNVKSEVKSKSLPNKKESNTSTKNASEKICKLPLPQAAKPIEQLENGALVSLNKIDYFFIIATNFPPNCTETQIKSLSRDILYVFITKE